MICTAFALRRFWLYTLLVLASRSVHGQAMSSSSPAFGKIRGARELKDGAVLVTDGLARALYVLDESLQTRRSESKMVPT